MACIRPPLTQRVGLPQPMLFDLDDAKEQFLHFYPLLTLNIEAPFGRNVKIINGNAARRVNLQCDLLSSNVRSASLALGERGDWYET